MTAQPFHLKLQRAERGFSLVELLVGLAVGLIVTLVITQTLIGFEGPKRTTSGGADAQTNGNIALYTVQRNLQSAGYGLPLFSSPSPLLCANSEQPIKMYLKDKDNNETTLNIGISPVTIVDGGKPTSSDTTPKNDTITIRYGNGLTGGLPMKIKSISGLGSGKLEVYSNMGCQKKKATDPDLVALAINETGTSCAMRMVTATSGTDEITLTSTDTTGLGVNGRITCMGTTWTETTYFIQNNTLMETVVSNGVSTTTPIMQNIVGLQARYGVASTANSTTVDKWVDATDDASGEKWKTLTVANRNRIKAVRIALVARNALLEKENVTSVPCNANGVCAWTEDTAASVGSMTEASIYLPPSTYAGVANASNQNYRKHRYRVFETTVPLRNIIWTSAERL